MVTNGILAVIPTSVSAAIALPLASNKQIIPIMILFTIDLSCRV